MQQSQPLISVLHRLQSDSEWLECVRHALGCEGAGICLSDGYWRFWRGTPPPPSLPTNLLAPDGEIATTSTGESYLAVPLLAAYETEPAWAVFWTSQPRELAELYRLLAKATSAIARNAMAHHRAAADHHAELIERAAATASIGVWGCTLPDETLSWSDGVYDLFELPRRSLVARESVLKLYTPESARELDKLRAKAIATLTGFSMDADIITAKGNKRVMRITATVDHVNGKATQIYGVKQDITAERALVEKTRMLAETDPLTGVANRIRFQGCLDDLHGKERGQKVGALLLIDLDNFKDINDTFGHLAGDACLIETARRLEACLPENALLARLGGDEFAIVTDASTPCNGSLATKILESFEQPIILNGEPCHVGISMGVADRRDSDVADTLYHNADVALYQAKQSGRGTWRVFRAA